MRGSPRIVMGKQIARQAISCCPRQGIPDIYEAHYVVVGMMKTTMVMKRRIAEAHNIGI